MLLFGIVLLVKMRPSKVPTKTLNNQVNHCKLFYDWTFTKKKINAEPFIAHGCFDRITLDMVYMTVPDSWKQCMCCSLTRDNGI